MLAGVLLGQNHAQAAALDYAQTGPHQVAITRAEWRDDARQRVIPVKIYFPSSATSAVPVIVFSHGLGGTREGYEHLGRHWASHGFATVHLQHPGSDETAWRGQARPYEALQQAVNDPRLAYHRPLDVHFALDELARLNAQAPQWRGRLDLSRAGMAGHSFGAWTTLAVTGMGLGPGARPHRTDSRIRAGVAMSAPAHPQATSEMFDGITVPVFHLTGTLDDSPLGDTRAADRRIPFDRTRKAKAYLLTLNGGNHSIFSGRGGLRMGRQQQERFLALIRAGTTAFWRAALQEDAGAEAWLANGEYARRVGVDGVFESKPAP